MGFIIKKFLMNKGAWIWFRMLELWCGLYQLLNHFFIEFFKNTKIENYIGIWGHSWYY